MAKEVFTRYSPRQEIGDRLTKGIYAVRAINFETSNKFNQDYAILTIATPNGDQKRHTFSKVLVEQLKDIVKTNSLPCEIEVKRVKRYLTLV